MKVNIPITIRAHEQDGAIKVYFEPAGSNAEKIAQQIQPGDRVVIEATVHELTSSGGYSRTVGEEVKPRAGFTLDIGDIVLYSVYGKGKR